MFAQACIIKTVKYKLRAKARTLVSQILKLCRIGVMRCFRIGLDTVSPDIPQSAEVARPLGLFLCLL